MVLIHSYALPPRSLHHPHPLHEVHPLHPGPAASTQTQDQSPTTYEYQQPTGGCGVNIAYHDPNPVMRTLKLVPMFYGTWTDTQKSLITTFLSGLGGSSWMGINNLYSDLTGPIANATGLYTAGKQYTFPTTPYNSLTVTQTLGLVKQGISAITGAAEGTGAAQDTIYMLLTGPDIGNTYDDASAAFCTDYCSWHSYYTQADGANIKIAWAGNAISKCPANCIPEQLTDANTPNGDRGIDGMLNQLAISITTTASDPLISTWYDIYTLAENAGVCGWQFGTVKTNAGKVYNVVDIKGNYYLLQMNLNPNTGLCVNGL